MICTTALSLAIYLVTGSHIALSIAILLAVLGIIHEVYKRMRQAHAEVEHIIKEAFDEEDHSI